MLSALVMSGCGSLGTGMLGGLGTQAGSGTGSSGAGTVGTIADVLGSVLGINKVTQKTIIGEWQYYQPGLAFESENLLSKAGGAVAAAEAKKKLQTSYSSLGISSSNTQFVFSQDNSFSGKINGLPIKGTYTLDESKGTVALKMLLGTYTATVRRSGTSGISLLFEGTKMLKLLQTLAAFSGNTGLQAIGELSKTYDGMLIGFDLR